MALSLVKSAWEAGSLVFRNKATRAIVTTISPQGMRRTLTVTDIDAQNGTITAAAIVGGIVVHTSTTGAGTLTFDTAVNILAAFPGITTGETIQCWVINDGNQTDTFAIGTGITITGTTVTLPTLKGCMVILLVTSSTTLTAFISGG